LTHGAALAPAGHAANTRANVHKILMKNRAMANLTVLNASP
jgi:hypothetical protein